MSPKHLTPKQVAEKLLEAFTARDPEKIMSLYADDFEVIAPFAFPKKMVIKGKREGQDVVRRHPGSIKARMYDNIRVKDFTVFETTDPEWIIMEWTYVSKVGDAEVENGNVCITQIRDGKVIQSRDYHNHVTRAVADGTVPQLLTTISQMELEQDRKK